MSENRGPSFENLRKLRGMLPSLIKGMKEGRTVGGGRAVQAKRPTKLCIACFTPFDFEVTNEAKMDKGICQNCQEKLQEGSTIFVQGERIAVMKLNPTDFSEMVGKIVECTEQDMDQIAKQFNVQQRVKHNSQASEGNNATGVA